MGFLFPQNNNKRLSQLQFTCKIKQFRPVFKNRNNLYLKRMKKKAKREQKQK